MNSTFSQIDYALLDIPTPCYVIDLALLRRNMKIMQQVQKRSGCKILLALKSFSTWSVFEHMNTALAGVACSSPDEVRLGSEKFGGEVHAYAPAYSKQDILTIIPHADHIIFNSFGQWNSFKDIIKDSGRDIECGLRINPEYSEVSVEIYNPCTIRSRFGIRKEIVSKHDLDGISGLHFHTMCQQGADVLARTLPVVEAHFGQFFDQIKWVNFGGGHHITRDDYDTDLLCELILDFSKRTGLQVYLEPGEAHILNTGVLVTEILDVIDNIHSSDIAIVDTSAAAHMPDILEMPYTPEIIDAQSFCEEQQEGPLEVARKYIIGGKTCLSGDVIGEYGLKKQLKVGDRLVLKDMAQYTLCKNTTFNGLRLPAIATCDSEVAGGDVKVVKEFSYEDFYNRQS